jgi:hypothetical protein
VWRILQTIGPYLFTLLVTGITFGLQDRAARKAREHAAAISAIPHHAEAYRRSRLILHTHDAPVEFLNEMLDWATQNRLYLTEAAYSAFVGAIHGRGTMNTKPPAHLNSEAFKVVERAPDLILKNSPRLIVR